MQGLGVERRYQSRHLVKQHSKGPYVRFEVIPLRLDDLWRQVVRRPHNGFGLGLRFRKHSWNPKITQLYDSTLGHEQVLGFQVAMQDLLVMAVLQRKADLGKPVQHLIFRKINWLSLVSDFGLIFYLGLEITIITIVHHDTKFPFLGFVDLSEASDVWMIQDF